MQLRVSDDLLNWSEPVRAKREGKPFGNRYVAAVSDDDFSQPNVITGDSFCILSNHNGTDVTCYQAKLINK